MATEHTDVHDNPFRVTGGLLYGMFLGASIKEGLTASSTETQEAATLLPATFNVVSTAGATDAVKLKPLEPGQIQIVKNTSANAIQVFPAADYQINGGTVDAADTTNLGGNGSTRLYICSEDDPNNVVSFELNVAAHVNG